MDGITSGQTEGRMEGWTDGQTNGLTEQTKTIYPFGIRRYTSYARDI